MTKRKTKRTPDPSPGRPKRSEGEGSGERYRALTLIWHRGHKRYYRPGEEFDLDHLSEATKWLLVETGIVELVNQKEE